MPNPPDQQPHGWHLKKEIQLGHLITTLTVVVSVAVYVQRIDQRLAIVEARQIDSAREQRERDERQDRLAAEAFSLVRAQLARMDEKLDRLMERSRK